LVQLPAGNRNMARLTLQTLYQHEVPHGPGYRRNRIFVDATIGP
jgi:hypothetical protein